MQIYRVDKPDIIRRKRMEYVSLLYYTDRTGKNGLDFLLGISSFYLLSSNVIQLTPCMMRRDERRDVSRLK